MVLHLAIGPLNPHPLPDDIGAGCISERDVEATIERERERERETERQREREMYQ